jgi:hypothetical protein
MLYVLTGPPLRVVCGNQLSCCFDTHLSAVAASRNPVTDETETSVCPPLSPAMEAINMEASITEHHTCMHKYHTVKTEYRQELLEEEDKNQSVLFQTPVHIYIIHCYIPQFVYRFKIFLLFMEGIH